MKSVKFKGCNKVFGLEGKVGGMFLMQAGENKVVAYKLNFWERLKALFGRPIWFWFQAQGIPNFSFTMKKPFVIKPPKKEIKK